METTTSEIQQRLYDSCVQELKPMAVELRAAGWSDRRIQGTIRFHLKCKLKQYYEDKKSPSQLSAGDLKTLLTRDSKAEAIFYEKLRESGIVFQFQYKIGPYRADYLVGESLVVELDGPTHNSREAKEHDLKRDAYLVKRGFNVLRLNLDIVALNPQAAIEGIKELTA